MQDAHFRKSFFREASKKGFSDALGLKRKSFAAAEIILNAVAFGIVSVISPAHFLSLARPTSTTMKPGPMSSAGEKKSLPEFLLTRPIGTEDEISFASGRLA